MGEVYSNPVSGGSIAAGFYRRPSWVRAQTVGTWGTVPASNTIASLDPKNNPAMNPNYPASPEWYGSGQSKMINGWNSMVVNQALARLKVWGGGHADYGGNEGPEIDLLLDTPYWRLPRPPSGAIGNPVTDGGMTGGANNALVLAGCAAGTYSDGRPRPTHTYNALVHVPGRGMLVTNLYYVFPNLGGPSLAYLFDEASNDWSLFSDYTALGDVNAATSGTCYDSTRNCVWILGQGAYNMLKIDCATGAATRHGAIDNHAQGPILKYDATNDLIYILSSSASGGWLDYGSRMTVFNPADDSFHVLPAFTGALAAGMEITGHGVGWDELGGRLFLWNGQTDRAKISVLTRPSSNLLTSAWEASVLTNNAGNAVTPTVPDSNGTFGRFDYVERLGGCVLINAVDQPVYFYKVK